MLVFTEKLQVIVLPGYSIVNIWQYGLWRFQTGGTKLERLAYLGAYGTHMFALWVWVGDGTSKTFFFLFYHFGNAKLGAP